MKEDPMTEKEVNHITTYGGSWLFVRLLIVVSVAILLINFL
jgi:hypothetical protein